MFDMEDSLPELEVKIAWLFAPEDDELQRELEVHLSPLKHSGQISTWNIRDLVPGTPLREIEHFLHSADLVVLLVSAHFLEQFHERIKQIWIWHQAGEVHIVPIILSPCSYRNTLVGKLATLPTGSKVLNEWRNRQAALASVEQGVRRVVEVVLAQKWVSAGTHYCEEKSYERALQAFSQALQHNAQDATAYKHKGDTLYNMLNYKGAIEAYEYAVRLDPHFGLAWAGLHKALKARSKEVQEYYEQRAEEAERRANILKHKNEVRGEQDGK